MFRVTWFFFDLFRYFFLRQALLGHYPNLHRKLGLPDGIGVRLRLGEEVYGRLHVVHVLVLPGNVVAGGLVAALVGDLGGLLHVLAVAVHADQGQVVVGKL